jgi:hypothetical protein
MNSGGWSFSLVDLVYGGDCLEMEYTLMMLHRLNGKALEAQNVAFIVF